MVKLPDYNDPTLAAADAAMVAQQRWRPRPYLGMSGIGTSCSRQLWYNFRWCKAVKFNAITLKRFADGNDAEDVCVKRLRAVEGITLLAVDPSTGYQHAAKDFGDHYKGHADGLMLGLIQAPKTWHVFEAKCSEKFDKLTKLKADVGEKNALQKWNVTYYAQAQSYMHYLKCDRHYLVCIDAGGRNWISVRTEYNKQYAEQLVKKAHDIIFSDTPPEKISDDPSWYQCGWCDYKGICHSDEGQLEVNCRTCLHSDPRWYRPGDWVPVSNPENPRYSGWFCQKHQHMLDYEQQLHGCDMHRFIPSLIHGEQIDAADDASWVLYRLANGDEWMDGERG